MITGDGLENTSINAAIDTIKQGGLLVYPTEGVYGIGCDYRSQAAVERLLQLKQRPVEKGLILAASHVQQVLPLICPNNGDELARALKTWPGHNTWVFEASAEVPDWIRGAHSTLAVRVSAHPVIKQLCDGFGHAIVSTSANVTTHESVNDLQHIMGVFGAQVDYYLDLPLGGQTKPSQIRNAADGSTLRI